jgi:protein-tyrosine kinase
LEEKLERIRDAIKLAKRSRDVSGSPSALGARPIIHPTNPHQAVHPGLSHDLAQSSLRMVQTNRKHLEENRIVGHLSDGIGTIPFEILRTKVIQEMTAQGWTVLVVTSPTQGCGKTVTAINLALSMAKLQGRSVYLVDMDLRKPAIAKYLGVPKLPGFNDYLYGKVEAGETLFNIDVAGQKLNIACNWDVTSNPAEAMASQHVTEFLTYLKKRQEQAIIIVDLPPLLVSDDVMSILPLADCCLLTVAENLSTSHDVVNCEELLATTNFLGCVYNKSREVNKNQYYY